QSTAVDRFRRGEMLGLQRVTAAERPSVRFMERALATPVVVSERRRIQDDYTYCDRTLRGHRQGRTRLDQHAIWRAQGPALRLRYALRRRAWHQSRGANRRRARRLLHHGA